MNRSALTVSLLSATLALAAAACGDEAQSQEPADTGTDQDGGGDLATDPGLDPSDDAEDADAGDIRDEAPPDDAVVEDGAGDDVADGDGNAGNDVASDLADLGPGGDTATDMGAGDMGGVDEGVELVVTGTTPAAIAHGGRVTVSGAGFTGASSVILGGVAQTIDVTASTDTALVLTDIDASTPIGTNVNLIVTTPLGTTDPFSATVVHLTLSEVDPSTAGADRQEFVEVDTGLDADIDLTGYTVVRIQGQGGLESSVFDLAETGSDGLFLIGSANTLPAQPDLVRESNNLLENGPDAVAIYQRSDFTDWLLTDDDALDGLIDAVAYRRDGRGTDLGDPTGTLPGLGFDHVEGHDMADRDFLSIQRCDRLGPLVTDTEADFARNTPTPGLANDCVFDAIGAACTVTFATCSDSFPSTWSECGAFVVDTDDAVACAVNDVGCDDDGELVVGVDNDAWLVLTDGALTVDYRLTLLTEVGSATITAYDFEGRELATAAANADCADAAPAPLAGTGDLEGELIHHVMMRTTGGGNAVLDGLVLNPPE